MDLANLSLDADLRARLVSAGIGSNVWPLLMDRRRGVLAVVPGGLIVFAPDGTTTEYLWSGLSDFEVEPMGLKLTPAGASFDVRLRFDHRLHSNEVQTAIANTGGPYPGVPFARPDKDDSEHQSLLPTTGSMQPVHTTQWTPPPAPPRVASSSTARAHTSESLLARTRLNNLFIGGVGIQILAGIIIGLAWPTSTMDPFSENVSEHGSVGWVLFGSAIAWAGSVLIGIAIIGWGVMLGNRASGKTT